MSGSFRGTVTFDLTVGGHVAGMPPVYGTPMMIMAMEKASASRSPAIFRRAG